MLKIYKQNQKKRKYEKRKKENMKKGIEQPSPEVKELMVTDDNRDQDRSHLNYRGYEDHMPQGPGKREFLINPVYKDWTADTDAAEKLPNGYVDLANTQNHHDHDEAEAIKARMERVGNPRMSIKKRRELARLTARLDRIDPNGDMLESHRRFKDNNVDMLIENARAQAELEDVQIRTPENVEREDADAELLASAFHDQWRETRRNEDGTFEPREKKTSDKSWIEKKGRDTVDIANTPFDDLPDDWRKENIAAAKVIIEIINADDGGVDLSDDSVRDEVGEAVHAAWLSRNEWAKEGELGVPFVELPQEEQEKDLAQVRTALKLFSEKNN